MALAQCTFKNKWQIDSSLVPNFGHVQQLSHPLMLTLVCFISFVAVVMVKLASLLAAIFTLGWVAWGQLSY